MSEEKREPLMIRIRPLKEKEKEDVKENPDLVANGRFRCLVALGRFHCLVALGRFHCLVALERFHCLMALGKVKEKHLFTSSHFPPTKFYLNLQFFSFDFKVLLTLPWF